MENSENSGEHEKNIRLLQRGAEGFLRFDFGGFRAFRQGRLPSETYLIKMKKRKERKELHWRLTYKVAQPPRGIRLNLVRHVRKGGTAR